jgi:LysM repeat protein
MGFTGNNGTNDQAAAQAVEERGTASSATPGTFRNGSLIGAPYADFLGSYVSVSSYQQGSSGGGYTVRSGDTLQGIAAALYGDGNLWYKIAEANGLSAGAALSEGQSLILPAGVTKNTHNAGTFQPYVSENVSLANNLGMGHAIACPRARTVERDTKFGVPGR